MPIRLNLDVRSCLEAIEINGSIRKAANALGVDHTVILHRLREEYSDPEVRAEAVRQAKLRQRAQDLNRIERKGFREYARVENAVAEYASEISKLLKGFSFTEKLPPKTRTGKAGGVIHWSDQHLNERVSLPNNVYDWTIAGRRLKKHVDACKRHCKAHGITRVLVAMTGDLLNSDRRLDELLANAGNRAKASVLAVDLYQQALRDLAQDVHVTVAAISGNESRLPQNVGWSPEVASDNYDFTIFEMLRLMLDGKGMTFLFASDPSEMVVNFGGQHILMMHGHGAMGKDEQKSVQEIAGRYMAKGITIDMVIWGHIHNANIGDRYARSSSLVGSNDFAEKALNLTGRASQNFYILHSNGGFDGVKIDLQNTDGIKGYNITERLESYNTKSADKVHAAEVIMKVVI